MASRELDQNDDMAVTSVVEGLNTIHCVRDCHSCVCFASIWLTRVRSWMRARICQICSPPLARQLPQCSCAFLIRHIMVRCFIASKEVIIPTRLQSSSSPRSTWRRVSRSTFRQYRSLSLFDTHSIWLTRTYPRCHLGHLSGHGQCVH